MEKYTIYSAETTVIKVKIRDKETNERIGTLTIDLKAQNAISWLHKNKHGQASTKRKTLLNLVKWLES
jgi:hypothetical protein